MKYRPEIDGLRALAVIPVILFHAGFKLFSGGFVGVDVFFVISGYLITTIIVSEMEQGTFSLVRFYERRARRIIPALFFMLLISGVAAWFWLLPNEMRTFSQGLVATSLFSSNFFLYKTCGYYCSLETNPLVHTWSLAVEEQFYMFFPLILIFGWKLEKGKLMFLLGSLLSLSLCLAIYYSTHNPSFNFLMLSTRFWELLIGAMASIFISSKKLLPMFSNQVNNVLSLIGFLLVIVSIFLFDEKIPHPSMYTLAPVLGALLIILFANSLTAIGKLLSVKIITGLGLISYSTYLWHQPIFAFAINRTIDKPGKISYLFLCVLAVFFGYLSWYFIEKPFRDKIKINSKRIFSFTFYGTLCFFSFGLAGHFSNGFPARFGSLLVKTDIFRENRQQQQVAGCKLYRGKFNFSTCLKGDLVSSPSVAIIGDSHGEVLVHELSNSFAKSNLSFIPFVKSGCKLNFYMEANVNEELQECNDYQKAVEDEVKANEKIKILIIVARWDSAELHGDSILAQQSEFELHVKTINQILALGKKIILIYPNPIHGKEVSEYMSKNILFYDEKLPMLTIDSEVFEKRIKYYNLRYDSIGSSKNVYRIETKSIFCNSTQGLKCISQVDGEPLYYDKSHLSNKGAVLIVDKIMRSLFIKDLMDKH